MKIAVSATGPEIEAMVDPRFGRCKCFVIVNTDTSETSLLENQFAGAGGAGIAVAQAIIGKKVDAVLTGNCGPNAFAALSAAGIQIVTGVAGTTVREAADAYKAGALKSTPRPTVPGHFGLGGRGGSWGGGGGQRGGGRAA